MNRGRAFAAGCWVALATLGTAQAAPIRVADDRGQVVVLEHPARRIVSLLPSLTETVCVLDACQRLVAVDRYSDWPASVRRLPDIGGLEDTQIERIVALKPDLVLAAVSSRAVDRLRALGLPVLALEPQNGADARRVIGTVAAALGEPAAGAALLVRIDAAIAAAARRVPPAWRGARVYFEVAGTPFAASGASFVGELLVRLRLDNIVPASLGAFPQLNPEFVLGAQPELVMGSAGAVAQMPQRPGWSMLRALQQRRVCAFGTDAWNTLVRPGPRAGEAAAAIADCLAALPAPPSAGTMHR